MIEIEAPDGTIVEFPEGTANDVIERAMQERFGAPRGSAGAAPQPVQAVDIAASEVPQTPDLLAPEAETTAEGLSGAVARGLAVPAAGAALGAAIGAPLVGVGAIPGALAGAAAGTLAQVAGDPIVTGVNALLGTKFQTPTEAMENLLTGLGVPEAKSEAERIVRSTAAGAAGGAGTVAIGRGLQMMAGQTRPLLGAIGRTMSATPAADVLGGAGAGLASEAVAESTGTLGQIGAGLVGGLAGGSLGAVGSAARRGTLPAVGEQVIPTGRTSRALSATSPEEEAIRAERAASLPVPIELAKFQRTRDFAQQQRARELAKNNEVGGPIRDKLDEQQERLRQNFERFVEGTGSEQWNNPYAQGGVIADALTTLAKREKTRIKALYNRAEAAGEMRDPVEYKPVVDFIAAQTPTTRERLAPVLKAVEEQIAANDPNGAGAITLKQMEDVRKLINKVAQPGTPDEAYGRELKAIIDEATQDAGGDVYKTARAARARYANEFENVSLINDLIGFKPGGVDRRVALERVVEHITRPQTSMDSLQSFKNLIDRAGPRGKRAMRELQGAVLENIRDAAYKGITRDQSGGVVIQPSTLNNTLRNLDRAGKLEAIFDKQTAQLLRDVNLVVMDLATAPPGSVNASGTSSAILNSLDMLAMLPGVGGLAAKGINKAREALQKQELRQEVRTLLDGEK